MPQEPVTTGATDVHDRIPQGPAVRCAFRQAEQVGRRMSSSDTTARAACDRGTTCSRLVLYLLLGIVQTPSSEISDHAALVVSFRRVAVRRHRRPAEPAIPASALASQNCRSSSSVMGRAPVPLRWRFMALTNGDVNSSSRSAYQRKKIANCSWTRSATDPPIDLFDTVHQVGDLAALHVGHRLAAQVGNNQPTPQRLVLVGGVAL